MPIKPENGKLYPGGSIRSPEWLAIRERIRARAGDCCEGCGVENGLIGVRLPDGDFLVTPGYVRGDMLPLLISWGFDDKGATPAVERNFRVMQIVCTVAHVDHGLIDHSDDNLRFWCQKCHNSHDAPERAKNAAATRKARKPITLLDLMEGPR